MFEAFPSVPFSTDSVIDLVTANTPFYVRDRGIKAGRVSGAIRHEWYPK
jgi:hypothetical protein